MDGLGGGGADLIPSEIREAIRREGTATWSEGRKRVVL